MPEYELMVVTRPTLDDAGLNALAGNVSKQVSDAGGEVTLSGQLVDRKGNLAAVEGEGWKARRLAYPIEGHKEGFYVVLQFTSPPALIATLERALELDENVLRYMTTRRDDD